MALATLQLVWRRSDIDQAMNVLNFGNLTALTAGNVQGLCDDFADAVATAFTGSTYRGRVATNWRLHRVQLRPLGESSFPPVSSLVGTSGLLGTGGADAQSALIAVAISLWPSTGRPGRMFLPGWDEVSSVANGRPSAGTSDAAVEFGQRLKTNFDAIDNDPTGEPHWGVYRRQSGVLDRINTVLRSSSSASAGWQTQRRRRFAIQAEE